VHTPGWVRRPGGDILPLAPGQGDLLLVPGGDILPLAPGQGDLLLVPGGDILPLAPGQGDLLLVLGEVILQATGDITTEGILISFSQAQ
jgi:hypothetical protein